MKKFLERNLGVILFYGMVIVGVLMVNYRFAYLNASDTLSSTASKIAINK